MPESNPAYCKTVSYGAYDRTAGMEREADTVRARICDDALLQMSIPFSDKGCSSNISDFAPKRKHVWIKRYKVGGRRAGSADTALELDTLPPRHIRVDDDTDRAPKRVTHHRKRHPRTFLFGTLDKLSIPRFQRHETVRQRYAHPVDLERFRGVGLSERWAAPDS